MNLHPWRIGDRQREAGFVEGAAVSREIYDEAQDGHNLRQRRSPLADANVCAARLLDEDVREKGGTRHAGHQHKHQARRPSQARRQAGATLHERLQRKVTQSTQHEHGGEAVVHQVACLVLVGGDTVATEGG